MPEENINQEFRLKKIDEIRNYLAEKINQTKLMSKKHKKSCKALNYFENLHIVTFTIIWCVSISAVVSLVCISTVWITISIKTLGIKKYKPIIKKNNNKDNEIVLLAKSILNSIEVLISKALIDSNVSHDEFVLRDVVLKTFYEVKKEIRNSNDE